MIKFLVMDVDGTLTDGKIYMGNDGEILKAFNIKDGCGIKDILPQYRITPVIITARESDILKRRCEELGINYLYQGVRNKVEKLYEIIDEYNKINHSEFELKDCAYIGDDILDLQCMKTIRDNGGLVGCPSDAVTDVKENVHYICKHNGGDAAVRDFIEWIIIQEKKGNFSQKVYDSLEVVKKQDVDSLSVGKYVINDELYFMVQEYTTKKEEDCKLESHKKYIDVQWILKGEEKIKTISTDKLKLEKSYDRMKDIMFWKPVDDMLEMVLKDGSYVVLYPNDAHMPCIAVGKQEKVKKIVIKIKI